MAQQQRIASAKEAHAAYALQSSPIVGAENHHAHNGNAYPNGQAWNNIAPSPKWPTTGAFYIPKPAFNLWG